MGASYFETVGRGGSAREAFNQVVSEAQYDFGHSGYSGTIAEKDSFKLLSKPDGVEIQDFISSIEDSDLVNDKWGPAACIHLGDTRYLFLGWASS